jgi:hypothetical protein
MKSDVKIVPTAEARVGSRPHNTSFICSWGHSFHFESFEHKTQAYDLGKNESSLVRASFINTGWHHLRSRGSRDQDHELARGPSSPESLRAR